MTNEEIAALRELLDRTESGPWTIEVPCGDDHGVGIRSARGALIAKANGYESDANWLGEVEFYCAARSALPALLDDRDALAAELAALRSVAEELADHRRRSDLGTGHLKMYEGRDLFARLARMLRDPSAAAAEHDARVRAATLEEAAAYASAESWRYDDLAREIRALSARAPSGDPSGDTTAVQSEASKDRP